MEDILSSKKKITIAGIYRSLREVDKMIAVISDKSINLITVMYFRQKTADFVNSRISYLVEYYYSLKSPSLNVLLVF